MSLMIPENHRELITFLNALCLDDAEELSTLFDNAPVTFSVAHLAEFICDSGFKKLELDEIYDLVELLVSLQYVRHENYLNSGMSTFIEDVVFSATDDINSDVDWSSLSINLDCLLRKNNSLLITAKALNVMSDYEHVFRSAHILTDARHVFSNDGDEKSLAMMVTHMFKIDHMKDGHIESMFVAMDSNDIRDLQKILDRALRKESELKRVSINSEIPFLDTAYLEV